MPMALRMTGSSDRPYFGRARTAAGLLIVVLVSVLGLLDAWSPEFQFDSIQLGLLLGTALLFLGVEAGKRLLGPP